MNAPGLEGRWRQWHDNTPFGEPQARLSPNLMAVEGEGERAQGAAREAELEPVETIAHSHAVAQQIGDDQLHRRIMGDRNGRGRRGIAGKVAASAHQEFATAHFTDKERIERCIAEGRDLFDRDGRRLEKVPIDDSYPAWVREHRAELAAWIA